MTERKHRNKIKCPAESSSVKKAPGIRLWQDYLWEKRTAILLFFVTAGLFLLVGGLYGKENVEELLYAAELSAFFWAVCGFFQGRKYVEKRRLLLLLEEAERAGEEKFDGTLQQETLERVKRQFAELGSGPLESSCLSIMELLEEKAACRYTLFQERQTAQNDYYMMWAHQIKTPIAAMKLLLENSSEDFSKKRFLLKEELFKIEQYVEMALHFQRLQSMEADLVLEECELSDLLKQSVRKYSVLFINKGVSLRLDDKLLLPILTDEKWFDFCIEQLLSNSIKYTAPKTGVISIYLSKQEEDTLVFEDNGIGIRSEDLPRIFERGFTGYNGRMDKKSTGIGLYLCKQILDRLGNEIRVESREGKGTKIFLKLNRRRQIRE